MSNFLIDNIQNIIYIIEGYSIWLWNIIFRKTREKAKKRLKICNTCNYNENGICKKCGCILKAKTRVLFDEDENGISIDGCPEKKW